MEQFTPARLAETGTATLKVLGHDAGRLWDKWVAFINTESASTRTVVEGGTSYATDKTGPLIVAQRNFTLQFTNTSGGLIFGTSTAEVRVAARAQYYVPLLGPTAAWKIEVFEKDGVRVCVIHAPALRVLTPVNFDTRTIEVNAAAGWLRFDRQEMADAARAEITPRLNEEARAQAGSVRDVARKTLTTLVRNWLLSSSEWGGGKINAIQVLFPDETAQAVDFSIPHFFD